MTASFFARRASAAESLSLPLKRPFLTVSESVFLRVLLPTR